ncbi:MAG TPA: hypothetical protein V6C90_27060, partial [Coleofasciculaceae cyanobacterium]
KVVGLGWTGRQKTTLAVCRTPTAILGKSKLTSAVGISEVVGAIESAEATTWAQVRMCFWETKKPAPITLPLFE